MARPLKVREIKDVKDPQLLNDGHVPRRELHVWYRLNGGRYDGWYKCVPCGGVAEEPTVNDLPQRFEKLTDQERALCPFAER